MAENVFIFGAGASYEGGVPLMNGFIEKAIDLSHSVELVGEARAKLRETFLTSFFLRESLTVTK